MIRAQIGFSCQFTESQGSVVAGGKPASQLHTYGSVEPRDFEKPYSYENLAVAAAPSSTVLTLASLSYPSGITRDLSTNQRLVVFSLTNTGSVAVSYELLGVGATPLPGIDPGDVSPGSRHTFESTGLETFGAAIETINLQGVGGAGQCILLLLTESTG